MTSGTPIYRQWVVVLTDGTPVVDWGDGSAVDLISGSFVEFTEGRYSHPIQDSELEMLKRSGRVADFDDQRVYVNALPEPPHRTIE